MSCWRGEFVKRKRPVTCDLPQVSNEMRRLLLDWAHHSLFSKIRDTAPKKGDNMGDSAFAGMLDSLNCLAVR